MHPLRFAAESTLPFEAAEYEGRLAGLRARMEETGAEACVFTSMHNIAYYSGFDTQGLALLRGVVDKQALYEITGNVANSILSYPIDKELNFFKMAEAMIAVVGYSLE